LKVVKYLHPENRAKLRSGSLTATMTSTTISRDRVAAADHRAALVRMRSASERIRNGSTRCGSMRASFGAQKQTQCSRYRWTSGSRIWSSPSKSPEAHSHYASLSRCPPDVRYRAQNRRFSRQRRRSEIGTSRTFEQIRFMSATGCRPAAICSNTVAQADCQNLRHRRLTTKPGAMSAAWLASGRTAPTALDSRD
jgi:hypothetical protein